MNEETNTEVTTDDVLASLGVTPEPEPEPSPEPEPEPTGTEPAPEGEDLEQVFGKSKANNAFAQMRVENKQYKALVDNLGKALGLQTNDPAAITDAVQKAIIAQQAQQQNIPADLLMKVNQLEQQNQAFQQAQLKQRALLSFNAVKTQYGLSDTEVTSFADKLIEAGINPFEQEIDLISQYKLLNYESIVEKEVKKALEEEAARAAKAAAHSTHPGAQTGSKPGPTEKISTVNALNAFLAGKQ